MFDEHHVLGRGKPDIIQHIFELNLVTHRLFEQFLVQFILADFGATFLFTILWVNISFGLGDQLKPDR